MATNGTHNTLVQDHPIIRADVGCAAGVCPAGHYHDESMVGENCTIIIDLIPTETGAFVPIRCGKTVNENI